MTNLKIKFSARKAAKKFNAALSLLGIGVHLVRPSNIFSDSLMSQRLEEAEQHGFSDVNDYFDSISENIAPRITSELFSRLSSYSVNFEYAKIIEVGAGSGRFSRQIISHIADTTELVMLESDTTAVSFLKSYFPLRDNVRILHGDYFNNKLPESEFKLVILPWFDMTLSLYKWNLLIKEGFRLLSKDGLLFFDFMDSQNDLFEVLSRPDNSPYYLVNGQDLDRIAERMGFKKLFEFHYKYHHLEAERNEKFHCYQKQ